MLHFRTSVFLLAIALLFTAPEATQGQGPIRKLIQRVVNGGQQTATVQTSSVQTVQSCPGGVCPTAAMVTTTTQQSAVQVTRSAEHWSFSGTIAGHLKSGHGVDPDGMTREQMLNLHDALHESAKRGVPTTGTATPKVPAKGTRTVTTTTFGLVSDWSEPKQIPEHVLAQVDEPADKPMQVADTFRETLTKAIVEARKNGKINFREAVKLRVAMRSPAFVQRAQELAVTQVAFSGEESDAVPFDEDGVVMVEGINWEGLAKFLEAFVPLLLSLLKAFGL